MLTAKSFLGIADACECAYGFSERCSEDTSFTISTFTASEISLDFLSETYLAVITDLLFLRAPCSNCFSSSLDFADRWEVKCVAGCTRSLDSPVQRNHYKKLWSSEMDISFFSLKVSSTHRTLFLPYFHSKRIKKKACHVGLICIFLCLTVAYLMQWTRGVVHWSSGSVNHSVGIDNTSWFNNI